MSQDYTDFTGPTGMKPKQDEPLQDTTLEKIVKRLFEAGVASYNLPDEKYLAFKDSTRMEAEEEIEIYIAAHYIPREAVRAAIGEDELPKRPYKMVGVPAYQRDQLRAELRTKLNLEGKD